jgi:hypothetical protein
MNTPPVWPEILSTNNKVASDVPATDDSSVAAETATMTPPSDGAQI